MSHSSRLAELLAELAEEHIPLALPVRAEGLQRAVAAVDAGEVGHIQLTMCAPGLLEVAAGALHLTRTSRRVDAQVARVLELAELLPPLLEHHPEQIEGMIHQVVQAAATASQARRDLFELAGVPEELVRRGLEKPAAPPPAPAPPSTPPPRLLAASDQRTGHVAFLHRLVQDGGTVVVGVVLQNAMGQEVATATFAGEAVQRLVERP